MSKTYNLNGLAGCVTTRRNHITKDPVSVYHGEQSGMGEGWVTVCEKHGSICEHTTLAGALHQMAVPEWCAQCQPEIYEYFQRQQELKSQCSALEAEMFGGFR